MSIELSELEEVLRGIDRVANKERIESALGLACALVERTAKEKAPKGDGELRRSITSKVEDLQGVVFTPLEYAPYVEYGTGAFREENPTAGYWVYVKNSDGGGGDYSGKRYSLEEAKQIVAFMRSKGLDATYTQGMRSRPYMRPALDENRERVLEIVKRGVLND